MSDTPKLPPVGPAAESIQSGDSPHELLPSIEKYKLPNQSAPPITADAHAIENLTRTADPASKVAMISNNLFAKAGASLGTSDPKVIAQAAALFTALNPKK